MITFDQVMGFYLIGVGFTFAIVGLIAERRRYANGQDDQLSAIGSGVAAGIVGMIWPLLAGIFLVGLGLALVVFLGVSWYLIRGTIRKTEQRDRPKKKLYDKK